MTHKAEITKSPECQNSPSSQISEFEKFPKFFQNFKNGAGPKNRLVHPELWVGHFGMIPDLAIFSKFKKADFKIYAKTSVRLNSHDGEVKEPNLESHGKIRPENDPWAGLWYLLRNQLFQTWWSKSFHIPKWILTQVFLDNFTFGAFSLLSVCCSFSALHRQMGWWLGDECWCLKLRAESGAHRWCR